MTAPTMELAQFIAGLDGARLPEEIRSKAAQHVLDILAGMFAGLPVPEAAAVLDWFAAQGRGETEIPGTERRTSGPAAAAAMAMLSHAAESDPIHAPTVLCAGAVTVPAALALAQTVPVSGAALIAAVVAGYEVGVRLGTALGSSRLLARGWWPTAVCGGAAAAGTAAKMLGLDTEATRNALALALVHTGGLSVGGAQAPFARNLLCGGTVRLGVEAALAARDGMAGPPEPLSDPRGFLDAFATNAEVETLTEDLGLSWAIADTSLKLFPSALQAQSALEAVQSILDQQRLPPSGINRVDIQLAPPMVLIVNRPDAPASWLGAAASLQYQVACLMLGREIVPGPVSGADSSLIRAMAKVTVSPASDLGPRYPAEWPARVAVRTAEWRTFRAEIGHPLGHPSRPISFAATAERFERYAADRLPPDARRRVVEAAQRLADAPSTDTLTGALASVDKIR